MNNDFPRSADIGRQVLTKDIRLGVLKGYSNGCEGHRNVVEFPDGTVEKFMNKDILFLSPNFKNLVGDILGA